MSSKLKNNIMYYYLSVFLVTIAYSLPHAVLTILLLDKGISVSSIMLIQAFYSLAILISEYPSGILADLYSKKNLFLISKLFLIVMFIIVIYFNSFIMMAIAWFIYGIASALDSGTIDVYLINKIKNSDKQIDPFIRNDNRISFISMIIGSSIGSFCYYFLGIYFYWISIIFVVLAILVIYFFFREENSNVKQIIRSNLVSDMYNQSKKGIIEITKKKELRLMILLTFSSQFFFQTHFQLWQAIFLVKDINKHNFYLIYIIFQIISLLAYSIPMKYLNNNKHKFITKIMIPILLFLILGILNYFNGWYFVILYTIWVFIFTVIDYISNYLFSKIVSEETISSLTSLKSSCGRVASLLSMLECSILINFINVFNTVIINFLMSLILSILIFYMYISYGKSRANEIK